MTEQTDLQQRKEEGIGYRDADKFQFIPVKNIEDDQPVLRKPEWMKIKLPADNSKIQAIKNNMRKHNLHSVCEEASCPNLSECFNHGTATFMILGAICTRRCPFCDVAHGKPLAPDSNEPEHLGRTIKEMGLSYVVITSVDRDDLRDGGATHFSEVIKQIRHYNPSIQIEILTPDFKGRTAVALEALSHTLPDVFNHNVETIPDLYLKARPGANYKVSLELLKAFKEAHPDVPTKSGLMLGLGETDEQIIEVMKDLRAHGVTMLTLGQYLAPSKHHLRVERYVSPEAFEQLKTVAMDLGFTHVAAGPFVRSSYHADLQAKGEFNSLI